MAQGLRCIVDLVQGNHAARGSSWDSGDFVWVWAAMSCAPNGPIHVLTGVVALSSPTSPLWFTMSATNRHSVVTFSPPVTDPRTCFANSCDHHIFSCDDGNALSNVWFVFPRSGMKDKFISWGHHHLQVSDALQCFTFQKKKKKQLEKLRVLQKSYFLPQGAVALFMAYLLLLVMFHELSCNKDCYSKIKQPFLFLFFLWKTAQKASASSRGWLIQQYKCETPVYQLGSFWEINHIWIIDFNVSRFVKMEKDVC